MGFGEVRFRANGIGLKLITESETILTNPDHLVHDIIVHHTGSNDFKPSDRLEICRIDGLSGSLIHTQTRVSAYIT